MEKNYIGEYILAASDGDIAVVSDGTAAAAVSDGESSLPGPLQQFYDAFKDNTPGEYTMGVGAGIDGIPFGPVKVTVDNTRVSVILTSEYESAVNKNLSLLTLQGYAQLVVFDRFYATCVLIGQSSPQDVTGIVRLVDHLTRTDEEREELEKKKIDEVKLHPSFYASIYNDPINHAESTCGIYIFTDQAHQTVSCEAVFQAYGLADFADNTAFGLAVAVSVNVNTFTNSMDFTMAGSLRFADSERVTVAGEVGILNGKLNAIGFTIKSKLLVATEIYLTKGQFTVKGFQESKVAVSLGGGMAFGSEIKIPDGLGTLKKALFPNLAKFHPLEVSVSCEINPMRNYYSLTGQGLFLGNIAVSASFTYDDGDWDAELSAGTVRNNYLNGSLTVDYHKRKDSWNLHGNFSCSVSVDFCSFVGIMVSGGVDVLLSSQDYTVSGALYNRKDLTISVSGMGKVKLFFSFNLSVQKTWVFNLSNSKISDPKLLMNSLASGEVSALENVQDVLVCESKEITEIQLPRLRSSGDVIEVKSFAIDEKCSASALVRFQVAAEYTLADSSWRLTHSDGVNTTVYTAENSAGIVTVQTFAHNCYELHLDTPEAGNWTLEIVGSSENSGGIYIDALQDEKFITALEIIEQNDSVIRFRYSAFTRSDEDTTLVRLFAEEISSAAGDNPYSGVIAYLEETENGEYIWEIPEEFRHNARYRFYISAAGSGTGTITESPAVETFLARHEADLECSWELAYSAENTDTVTAYITVTNTGTQSTFFMWEVLDHTNNDSVEEGDFFEGAAASAADVIASGKGIEIKGSSTITFEQVITVTDELRSDFSALQLAVTQCTAEGEMRDSSGGEEECHADDTDETTFAAMDSLYCQEKTISWQAVAGAASYVLHYALEGDWEESGVYINNIYGTSYTLSAAPGEYLYRVIALDSEGEAIGSWSEEQELDLLFSDVQIITVSGELSGSRTAEFSLNDGIYDLKGFDTENFTGTVTLYRSDLVKTDEENSTVTFKEVETEILQLTFTDGKPDFYVSEILLDHGDYFWEWERTEGGGSDTEVAIELSGEVFSMEQKDREIIFIGNDDHLMPFVEGSYVETLEGEVGFCNKDAFYYYMTDEGGEVTLTVKGGTHFDFKVQVNIFVQNSTDAGFECVETLTVAEGEYTADSVLLESLAIRNNFYVQIVSWDGGKGEYNTDYSFELSFDPFENSTQEKDILQVNGGSVSDWIGCRNEAHSYLLQIRDGDRYAVRLQGDAFDAVLKVCTVDGAVIAERQIEADGRAFIDDIFLEKGNYFVVVDSTDKGEGYCNTDYVLSACELKKLYPKIDNSDDTRELASLQEFTELYSTVGDWIGTGDSADYFKVSLGKEELQNNSLLLNFDKETARAVSAGIVSFICCDKWGEELTVKELSSGQWEIETGLAETEIYIGILGKEGAEDVDYSFKLSAAIQPGNLSGSADGISWEAVPGTAGYRIEFSTDSFATVFSTASAAAEADLFGLPAGEWQWRVKAVDGLCSESKEITVEENVPAQKFVSDSDGNTDIFFACGESCWGSGFAAQHQVLGEMVMLEGLNRIGSTFSGSDDAGVLVLSDEGNGDALFLDDIYTVNGNEARLAQIDEIRAGAGDDIVDVTSQRFAYTGHGIKIYGGSGNDTIWAGSGQNILLGDEGDDRLAGGADNDIIAGGSGNDRMHGGGGEDIFCFGADWGSDTVEQFDTGIVILWFAEGSQDNWDAQTLTYTDGANSVTVTGVDSGNVILKFGLSPELPSGAFCAAASEKIFGPL